MKLKKNLVLLGMMGSGKSTIGKLIARKLNLRFIDTDFEIEKKASMKITEIFDKKGEEFFRDLEEKVLTKALDLQNCIIALGGGSFVNERIRKLAIDKSITFWLSWGKTTLIKRISQSKKRPIAYKLSKIELTDLIKKRAKIYTKAKHKILCEKKTKSQIIGMILKIYENE